MMVHLSDDARIVDDRLYDADDGSYGALWDVLDRILGDPEEAPHRGWSNYVSTRRLWGTKIPGTDYTVYWRITGDTLEVAHILADRGV